MEELIINFIQLYGLIAAFFLMMSNGFIGFPPSEATMGLAGIIAFLGYMDISLVVLAGVIGNVLGAVILYYVGSKIGYEWLLDFKKYLNSFGGIRKRLSDWLPKHEFIDKFIEMFKTKESFIYIGILRCFPVIRSIISLPAGIVRMPFNRFLLYTTLGCTVWIGSWAGFGYILGEAWYEWSKGITLILFIVLIMLMFYLKSRLKNILEI